MFWAIFPFRLHIMLLPRHYMKNTADRVNPFLYKMDVSLKLDRCRSQWQPLGDLEEFS
jgi:hypothetical protein